MIVPVTRSEVARLADHGTVEEAASFKSGGSLVYRIQSRTGTEPLSVVPATLPPML